MAATPVLPVSSPVRAALAAIDRVVARALVVLLVGCFAALLVVVGFVVVTRVFSLASAGWTDELIELLFAWLVFGGAALLWREQGHFAVTLVADLVHSPVPRRALALLIEAANVVFLVVFTMYSCAWIVDAAEASPVFAISRAWWYGALPVSGVLMIAYSIARIVALLTGAPRPLRTTAS